ncbi:MAG: response regulator transcription factor [Cellulosilyticaceae bacterium]
MAKILIVDDEAKILRLLTTILEKNKHEVTTCLDFSEMPMNDLTSFQLILLDIMMPNVDGFEICQLIRSKVDCPILFLTAKAEENAIVYGLGLGADDYIQKPFGMAEILARINAHLRRERREHTVTLDFENIRFDLNAKKLLVRNKSVGLTTGEYKICEFIAKNKGQVFSREQIYEAVFGYDGESNDSTIATHVKNIRLKLETEDCFPIQTVWGIGYKWEVIEDPKKTKG